MLESQLHYLQEFGWAEGYTYLLSLALLYFFLINS